MARVNIADAKARLSELIDRALAGEEIDRLVTRSWISTAEPGSALSMQRALATLAALVALLVGVLGDLPGPHRCALQERVAALNADPHACCPDRAPAVEVPEGPVLCEGDCCGPVGDLALAFTGELPPPPSLAQTAAPPRIALELPRPRDAVQLAGSPRGPPHPPPRSAPWLRHRSLLL